MPVYSSIFGCFGQSANVHSLHGHYSRMLLHAAFVAGGSAQLLMTSYMCTWSEQLISDCYMTRVVMT